MRRSLIGVMVAAVFLAAACSGGGGGSSGGGSTPQAGSGELKELPAARTTGLLIPRDQRLVLRDMKDGQEFVIKRAQPGAFYAYPRWSPDGTRIAYVIKMPYTGYPNQEWGDAIAVSAPDGSNERIVFKNEPSGTTIEGLAWTHDGTGFYAGVLETNIKDGRFLGQKLALERIDLATGGRRALVDEAGYPTAAPDGSRIGYITFSTADRPGGLWTAKPDASDRKLIQEATGRFLTILQPRYAPDSASIAFAAVATASGGEPKKSSGFAFRWPWQPRTVSAHGLPQDIWTVPATGGDPRKLTEFLEDEPSPAWSPDGKEIAVIATGGLYEIASTGGDSRKIGLGGTQAQIDWR